MSAAQADSSKPQGHTERRSHWMSILARSQRSDLEQHWHRFEKLPFAWLKKPEFGTMLVQGRMNGNESRFNFGEVTLTRCSVQLDDGRVGVAYVGRCDKRHALMAAIIDACLQKDDDSGADARSVVEDLSMKLQARHKAEVAKAKSSRVDFTMVVRD